MRAHSKDGTDLPLTQALMRDAKLTIAPGETYDFDYQPQDPGNLILEFKAAAQPLKIAQQISVE